MLTESLTEQREQELLAFEEVIGIKFNNIALLNTALTHTSYANERERQIPDNEKLEFLGDAVLELSSSTYLYNNFVDFSEGELTKTRASIVCQDTLSRLARKLNMGKLLLLGRGEESNGGRGRDSTLEDAFEAVIGAIYLDQGWEAAKNYVIKQLAPEFDNVKNGINRNDYKTVLQEIVQQTPTSKLTYIEISVNGPDHNRTFEYAVDIDGKMYGSGIGKSKKSAEQMAAKETLKQLQNPSR